MSWRKVAGIGSGIVICAALFLLVWSLLPSAWSSKSLQLSSGDLLELTWTNKVRTGETGYYRLTVIAPPPDGELSNSSTSQAVDGLKQASRQIVEARLDHSDLLIKPSQDYQQPLLASQPVRMEWSFTAPHSGIFPSAVWVYLLRFSGESSDRSRELVAVIQSPVEANSLLWVDQTSARWLALLGLMGGGLIFLWIYVKRKKELLYLLSEQNPV